MRLRSVFLAGCVALALPGLVQSGFTAVQAFTGWRAAQAARHGTQAAGAAMRAAEAVMVERGATQQAIFTSNADSNTLAEAEASTDATLVKAEAALAATESDQTAIDRIRGSLAAIRSRVGGGAAKRATSRVPTQQYGRVIETLDDLTSTIERQAVLANPAVGLLVGLAREAGELRDIAGRRGALLHVWLAGEDLAPVQKDELLAITGRLAEAWERVRRSLRASGLTGAAMDALDAVQNGFFAQDEPWYRELVKTALANAERPMAPENYRTWHIAAVSRLLPLREVLIVQAASQAQTAINAQLRGLLASAGFALVSLALVIAAAFGLLRGLVDPVRAMTASMSALAAGDLGALSPARGRLDELGAMASAVAVFRETAISLTQREAELQRINLRFAAALENMSQGLAMYDSDGRLAVFNRRYCEINGLPGDRVEPGMTLRDIIELGAEAGNYPGRDPGQVYGEIRDRLARLVGGGEFDERKGERTVSIRIEPMGGGGWVATFEDVTERRATESRIAHMAHHDALTGLPNRLLLRQHMEHALAQPRAGEQLAILCLDLDGFKTVNDTFGHPAGDDLLRQVARRLRDSTRDSDLVARLGGDEFAIIQVNSNQPEDAASLAERLTAMVRMPFHLGEQRVEVGTSIGIVLAGEAGSTADELLRNADIALYRAKAAGRGTWRFFEPEMGAELLQRRALETDLRRALAEDQFAIHYQPIVHAVTRAVTGFEALLRWHHPERGMISPAEFIPLAEETGLIRPLGLWVLIRACADAAKWPAPTKVAVNLSPAQFAVGNLVSEVEQAVAAAQLAPNRLELEITETVLLQDNDSTLATLHRLRALGVRVSMDDFGTGYSSLSYLRRFPFDKIKIDQSFVRNLDRDQGSIEIVRAVVGLGKALGMQVLAEGVETPEQHAVLSAEGCDELQGYLFSKPRPVAEVPGIIASFAPTADELTSQAAA